MTSTPKASRPHIAIFGRRNAGKSTLMNLVTGQSASLVSPTPGTTADPVEKAVEFPPLGPVVWIDTAGLDDDGELGGLRAARSREVTSRTDMAVIVFAGEWGDFEQNLYDELAGRTVPLIVVRNKIDVDVEAAGPTPDNIPAAAGRVDMAARSGTGLEAFRQAVIAAAPAEFVETPAIVRDLVPAGSCVLLVTPIDSEAPKGRLILPQVQTLRDLLDGDCYAVVTKETQLARALAGLTSPPALVVTDSQAFSSVAAALPAGTPLTGFSLLFARAKGDLSTFAAGAAAITRLKDGDVVLVAESCAHHSGGDDIGRVKIPALISKKSGAKVQFRFASGSDFPADLTGIKLVVQCGGCMANRRAILSRIARAAAAGVPITNYGVAIAYCMGLLERALSPFPEAGKQLP